MPLATEHFARVLARYTAMLNARDFAELDRELYEGTWSTSAELLSPDEAKTVGAILVEFELAVANRGYARASEALQRLRTWVEKRRLVLE